MSAWSIARFGLDCYVRIVGALNNPAPDGEENPSPALLPTARMELFSDGVLAIAITLLVLDVPLRPPGSPADQFLRCWPS